MAAVRRPPAPAARRADARHTAAARAADAVDRAGSRGPDNSARADRAEARAGRIAAAAVHGRTANPLPDPPRHPRARPRAAPLPDGSKAEIAGTAPEPWQSTGNNAPRAGSNSRPRPDRPMPG